MFGIRLKKNCYKIAMTEFLLVSSTKLYDQVFSVPTATMKNGKKG